jgi:hypothetical protein
MFDTYEFLIDRQEGMFWYFICERELHPTTVSPNAGKMIKIPSYRLFLATVFVM